MYYGLKSDRAEAMRFDINLCAALRMVHAAKDGLGHTSKELEYAVKLQTALRDIEEIIEEIEYDYDLPQVSAGAMVATRLIDEGIAMFGTHPNRVDSDLEYGHEQMAQLLDVLDSQE